MEKTTVQKAQEAATILNKSTRVGVLLDLLAEELDVAVDQEFWKTLVTSYQKLMVDQQTAQDAFADMINKGEITRDAVEQKKELNEV